MKSHSIVDGPSTSKLTNQVASRTTIVENYVKNYHQSPINSNESDVDLCDSDPTYSVDRSCSNLRRITRISSSSSSSSSNTAVNAENSNTSSVPKTTRSRKRIRDPSKWKQNIAKQLRNSGKAYISSTKKEVPARCIKDACKC